MRLAFALCLLVLASGCGGSDDPSGPAGPCDPTLSACELEHEFPSTTIASAQELESLCQSWTLHNPTDLWVNTVDFEAGDGWHHSNWFYVPDDLYAMPDGWWECDSFDELTAALAGGFLFAQSTQSHAESQVFVAGGAIRIPQYSRIVAGTHLLNASGEDVSTNSAIKLHTIPPDAVTVKLTPFRLTYHDLHIPPGAKSEFTSTCDLAEDYATTIGEPMQFRLYHLLSHYHTLGSSFRMAIEGGSRDGDVIHERSGTAGQDTFGIAFDPPLELADLTGLRFTCGYDNPGSVEVGWGIGDQEMCVVAGFAETKMAFDAVVRDDTGAVVETTSDGTVRNEGPCDVSGFPWNHDHAGGKGP